MNFGMNRGLILRGTAWMIAVLITGAVPRALAAPNAPSAPSKPVPAGAEALFGLRPGMDLEDARETLRPVGSSHSDPQNKSDSQNKSAASKDSDKKDNDKKEDAEPEARREEEGEGHTELWTLRGTPFAQIVLKADTQGRVLWITAITRADQPLAFTRFGAAPRALVLRDTLAVWNVLTPKQPPYRLIVRGEHGRARVISLILLAPPRP